MHGHPDRLCVREGSEKREMMDLELWKQRREELMHEAKQNRLARALRDSREAARCGPGIIPRVGAQEARRPSSQIREIPEENR